MAALQIVVMAFASVKLRVQLLMAVAEVLVSVTVPVKPVPQSLVSTNPMVRPWPATMVAGEVIVGIPFGFMQKRDQNDPTRVVARPTCPTEM